MRHRCPMVCLAILLASCGDAQRDRTNTAAKVEPAVITDSNFEKDVLQSKIPVLVDFWAPWCGPCLALAPAVDELAGEFAGKVKVVKVNVDDAKQTSQRYEVDSIPRLMLFKDGKIVSVREGVPPGDAKAAITQWLNESVQ